jgi:hypothetical protein
MAEGGQVEDYAVRQGDTLMKIAFATYGDVYKWKSIYEANKDKISNPNSIPKGIVIKVERPSTPVSVERNGEKYLIKNGDTLGKISNNLYGSPSKWKKLWEYNKQLVQNPNKIFSGFYLYYLANADEMHASEPEAAVGAVNSAASAPPPAVKPEPVAAAPAPHVDASPPANMTTGNMTTGNMATGNMATGNMATGNMATGNMATGGSSPVVNAPAAPVPPAPEANQAGAAPSNSNAPVEALANPPVQ